MQDAKCYVYAHANHGNGPTRITYSDLSHYGEGLQKLYLSTGESIGSPALGSLRMPIRAGTLSFADILHSSIDLSTWVTSTHQANYGLVHDYGLVHVLRSLAVVQLDCLLASNALTMGTAQLCSRNDGMLAGCGVRTTVATRPRMIPSTRIAVGL